MALVEDVQEGEGGVGANFRGLGRVDEVPGAGEVGIGHIEAGIEGGEGGEGEGPLPRFVRAVDGFVFRFVGGGHVPVEIRFQPGRVGVGVF